MPRSPAMVSIGSPGMRRTSTNTSSVIPMKVGTTRLTRVRMNRSMSPSSKRHDHAVIARSEATKQSSGFQTAGLLRFARNDIPLLLHIDAVEDVAAERRELEVDDALAHRL